MWKLLPIVKEGRTIGCAIRSIDRISDDEYCWLKPFFVRECGTLTRCIKAARNHAANHLSMSVEFHDLFVGSQVEFAAYYDWEPVLIASDVGSKPLAPLASEMTGLPRECTVRPNSHEPKSTPFERDLPPVSCAPSYLWVYILLLAFALFRLFMAIRAGHFG